MSRGGHPREQIEKPTDLYFGPEFLAADRRPALRLRAPGQFSSGFTPDRDPGPGRNPSAGG
eukprot:9419711-Alexandrium_andersonii.AAC.1